MVAQIRRGDFSFMLPEHRSRRGFALDGLFDLNWDSVTPNVGCFSPGERDALQRRPSTINFTVVIGPVTVTNFVSLFSALHIYVYAGNSTLSSSPGVSVATPGQTRRTSFLPLERLQTSTLQADAGRYMETL